MSIQGHDGVSMQMQQCKCTVPARISLTNSWSLLVPHSVTQVSLQEVLFWLKE